MERLDTITRRVLADLRDRMDKAGGTAVEAVPPLAREAGGGNQHARNGDHHPRSSIRSVAKRTTGMEARIRAPK